MGSAQGAAYLKLGDIKGESQDEGHLEEIELLAWSWGTSNSMNGSGSLCVMDVSLAKYTDSATVDILMGQMMGTQYPDAEISMTLSGTEQAEDYFTLRMRNVSVSSYQTGGSGDQRMSESVSLHFDEATIEYRRPGPDGKPGAPELTRISSSSHKCH
ncbi:Hcp family type VI secretion system effector [Shewanella litorisediminis]|uniref:Type VI secretion system tube protein Hcp n=1 Tax=Shewanella litorisediminis TaxID=1173586 RepID=A0ABX7G5C6_9GAMM|nr:type VI secretion system tube protein Hcp [Shewanella litorisediminis]MCL2918054.1 type VI secretion system tube protein Hcp [Shewanella litorisediminis]QRH02484.1 type VI secretion system tube protein Hcp [Shewanella litorisediminis]